MGALHPSRDSASSSVSGWDLAFELGASEILEVTTLLATQLSSGHLFQQIGVGSLGVFLEVISSLV